MPNNYVLLERIELNASAASVTFANIPQTGYTDLKVVASIRNNGAQYYGRLYFNGNTTGYSRRGLYGDGTSAGSLSIANEYTLVSSPSTYTANTFANFEIYIPNYQGSTNKSFSIDATTENNATLSYAWMYAGLWSNTAAITSIVIEPNPGDLFVANSTFSLYGLAATGTTPTIAPKASGGNVIATDGTYWYHAFLANGTFTPQTGLTAEALVIAGGGGGGHYYAGGGGAGGLLAHTSQSLTATGYTVTVGAGGAAGTVTSGSTGVQGNNSQFGALTASVGGGFGSGSSAGGINGGAGGSGGGAGGTAASLGTGGAATSGQGNAGGTKSSGLNGGSGGGGAGVAGQDTSAGGSGGNGLSAYSSWGLATTTGQNVSGTVYYAGGGGGSGGTGAGGLGGGGAKDAGASGTANTGGGGGGGNNVANTNGAGGSGIVIIRYLAA